LARYLAPREYARRSVRPDRIGMRFHRHLLVLQRARGGRCRLGEGDTLIPRLFEMSAVRCARQVAHVMHVAAAGLADGDNLRSWRRHEVPENELAL
jgi:hypothetical protein